MKHTILIVDDDAHINELVKLYLEKEGYEVATALTGTAGLQAFREKHPQLVVLDIMLPEMDGWQVCREIRKTDNTPILMLTAKGETFDKVLGLELGSDDYMVKPFDPKELVARVKALLRRSQRSEEKAQVCSFPLLTVNIGDYTVTYQGRQLDMPPKEIELLYFLASHPNKVYTREQLLEQVWGFEYFGDSRTVDVHVKRIREKLPDSEGWAIKTVWGIGYKFEVKA